MMYASISLGVFCWSQTVLMALPMVSTFRYSSTKIISPRIHAINMDFFSESEYLSTNLVKPDVAFAFRIMAINEPKRPTVSIIHMFPVSDNTSYMKSRYPQKNPVPYAMTEPIKPPSSSASNVFLVTSANIIINTGGSNVMIP